MDQKKKGLGRGRLTLHILVKIFVYMPICLHSFTSSPIVLKYRNGSSAEKLIPPTPTWDILTMSSFALS